MYVHTLITYTYLTDTYPYQIYTHSYIHTPGSGGHASGRWISSLAPSPQLDCGGGEGREGEEGQRYHTPFSVLQACMCVFLCVRV